LKSSSWLNFNPDLDYLKRSKSNAINLFKQTFRGAIKPSRYQMSLIDWASKNVRLRGPRPGPINLDLTPHMVEPYRSADFNSKVTDIILMFGSQMGKSTFCEIATGFYMVVGTGNIGYAVANDELLERIREVRVNKILEQVPELAGMLEEVKAEKGSKKAKDTIKLLNFGKAYLCFMSMQSVTAMSNIDCQVLVLEEVRDAPNNIKNQGCPVKLLEKRRSTYDKRSKRLIPSTPSIKSEDKEIECKVWREFQLGSQEYWSVPCPHCGHYHQLDPKNAIVDHAHLVYAFACPACGGVIEESDRDNIVKRGKYIAKNPAQINRFRSFHNNQFMTVQGIGSSWEKLLRDWEQAQSKEAELITYTNTVLGLPYSKVEIEADIETLKLNQTEYLPSKLPAEITHITAGFDFQKTWAECSVWGWDAKGRQFFIERNKVHGVNWEDIAVTLVPFLQECFGKVYQVGFRTMPITGGFLDAGYQAEKIAYAWSLAGSNPIFQFIKGESRHDDARSYLGKTFVETGSLKLPVHRLNTFKAKETLYSRYDLAVCEKGSLVFPFDVQDEIFIQLTSEVKIHSKYSGKPIWERKNGFVRNEVLDCTVYAILAHDILISDFKNLSEVEEVLPAQAPAQANDVKNDKINQVKYDLDAGSIKRIPSAFDD
jgi:phage terminase large subunit GpA-like protein